MYPASHCQESSKHKASMVHVHVLSCIFEALHWCALVRSGRLLARELRADIKDHIFCFPKPSEAVVRLHV